MTAILIILTCFSALYFLFREASHLILTIYYLSSFFYLVFILHAKDPGKHVRAFQGILILLSIYLLSTYFFSDLSHSIIPLGLADFVCDGEADAVRLGVPSDGVALGDADFVCEGDADAVLLGVPSLGVADGLADFVRDGVPSLGVADGECEGVELGLALAVREGVPSLGVALGDCEGLAE